MIERIQHYLQQLSARERWMVGGGAVLGSILLILAIVLPLQSRVSAAQTRIEKKRDDLIWLRSMSPQLAALQTARPPALTESLVVLIDRTARESGIGKSLVNSQPSGDGGLNVRLEKMPFDSLIAWLAQLNERYGVRVDSATVDAAGENGTVTATLILRAG
jgi:general secretion pathway protein M